jgi:predicted enzyme related to lactoylglutathione lyase
MKNAINWFEPVKNLNRAQKFYRNNLGAKNEPNGSNGMKSAFFPADMKQKNWSIVESKDYQPSDKG